MKAKEQNSLTVLYAIITLVLAFIVVGQYLESRAELAEAKASYEQRCNSPAGYGHCGVELE